FGDALVEQAEASNMSPEELLNSETEGTVPAGSDGLMTIHDWLAPSDKPFRKGIMIGFDERHTRAHLYHSILEGICLTMKNHVDALCAERQITVKEMIISGGGSNGDLMMQMMADIFGVPVKRNDVTGSASLGAAINTAVALNEYTGYQEAVDHMVRVKDSFLPDENNHTFYEVFNTDVYSKVTDFTDDILQKLHAL
ncbi:FGGY-family carbohydrate kinase, partial [Lentibacillus sp.]|uniref:FGGY-family carbohydrate kinase n=1 Tax=Lentibacillus sp. TaxID=1925746 RepID=UPI002B4B72E0